MQIKQWTFATVVLILSSYSMAFDADHKALLEDYNQKYAELIEKKAKWPAEITSAKQALTDTRTEYDDVVNSASDNVQRLEMANREVELQSGNLEFLKQVEPVSIQTQIGIQNAAVNAGEFNNSKDVTTVSLQKKTDTLQVSVNSLVGQISDKRDEISDIENSLEYQSLLQTKSNLTGQKKQKQNELSSAQSILGSHKSTLSIYQSRLQASKERENAAKIKAIEIRTSEIPTINTQIDQLKSDIKNIKETRKKRKENRKKVRQRRKANKKELTLKEAALIDDPTNATLQSEINTLKNQISKQDTRIQNITERIEQNSLDVQSKNLEIGDRNSELSKLSNLALQKDQEAGNEAIAQIGINGNIKSTKTDIADQKIVIKEIESEVSSLNSQISAAQANINQFRKTNIKPIEEQIDVLNSQKWALQSRQSQLLEWKEQIEAQDANIAESNDRIKDQLVKFDNAVKAQADFQKLVDEADTTIASKKSAYNSSVRAYNSLSQRIETTAAEFNQIEKEVLEFKQNLLDKEVEDVQ